MGRLIAFGEKVREPSPTEFVTGFKAVRKAELLDTLCAAYAAKALDEQPRRMLRTEVGEILPATEVAELLKVVRMLDWRENVRPGVDATGYIVLKPPSEHCGSPGWRDSDPRVVRRRV